MIYVDKNGSPFEVRLHKPKECSALIEMYDDFSPKGKFQSIPPAEKNLRVKWLEGLLKAGENLLAWRSDEVIGHVVLLPNFTKHDAEYLILVHQSSRGIGVGTMLTRASIERARSLGLQTLWLSVDRYNFRAKKLYKKSGFVFDADSSAWSQSMTLNL